jgi:hypothetical protein
MMYNSSLADELIGVFEANPERHDNTAWISDHLIGFHPSGARVQCGTTCCVAGWTAVLTLDDNWILYKSSAIHVNYNKSFSYDYIARCALGITREQASWLFSPLRMRSQVIWALKWLRDNQGATLYDIQTGGHPRG